MSDAIERLNAALEGRYEVEREIGEGGMATVFLAKDLKHNRNVALKVLKPELAAVVGAERFLAEIETTANLQHPHILPLHDSGEADGALFYVMPYVEGESVRDRLDREHQLPVDEAIAIAVKVAGALQTAHEHSVIHRDIKPANILLANGEPLVADFGIALAVDRTGGGRLTESGMSLGTPHYMSPEQATGDQSVGPPTDVYALGCVLYEMLIGEAPYTGSTPQAVLGKIITSEPESLVGQRRSVPPNVDAAVTKALETLPADRFVDVRAFAAALQDPSFATPRAVEPVAAATRTALGKGVLAGVSVTAVAAVVLWIALRPDPVLTTQFFDIALPPDHQLTVAGGQTFPFDVSRDGRLLVYVTEVDGIRRLFVRRSDDSSIEPLDGTEGARHPFFSPSAGSVGFFAEDELRHVDLSGGAPVTIARAPGRPYGASWGEDGTILYSLLGTGLYSVTLESGDPVPIEVEPPEGSEALAGDSAAANVSQATPRWPAHLPDGRHALITLDQGTGVLDLEDGELYGIADGGSALLDGSQARYLETGHLVYHDGQGRVRSVGFDLGARQVTTAPASAIDGYVLRGPGGGAANFRLTADGTLYFVPGDFERTLVLVDPETNETTELETKRGYRLPRFSPDGSSVAVSVDPRPTDIWLIDLDRGTEQPLTTDAHNMTGAWSPDGDRIAHWRDGWPYVMDVASRGPSVPLWSPQPPGNVFSWPEPSRVVLVGRGPGSQDISLFDLTDGTLTPWLATPASELQPAVSPDLRWLAYQSDASDVFEVYAQPYPDGGSIESVSIGGGVRPVWSSDSRQLFYRRADTLKVVDVSERAPYFGTPRTLMVASQYDFTQVGNWDVSRDGIVALVLADPFKARRFGVIMNFGEDLRSRVR